MHTLFRRWYLLASVFTFMPLAATADVYLSLDALAIKINTRAGESLVQDGLRFRLGTVLTERLDTELQFGFAKNTRDIFDRTETFNFGLYIKGHMPLGYHSSVYLLGGINSQTFKQRLGDTELNSQSYVPGWGVGVETALSERMSLSADYMQWFRNEGVLLDDVSSLNIGVKFFF